VNARESFASIIEAGLIPVVRAASAEWAIQAVEACLNGGIWVAEITMTVPGALRALEKLADRFGDRMLLGAGTVLDAETARVSILAGAEFLVSPNLRPATIEMAKRYSKAVFPGALTPTEVLAAWEAGADAVKVFPCGNVGGAKYIRALKGPFPQIEMVPTGGVSLDTAPDFFKAGACALGVGSELADSALMKDGRFDEIERRAQQFLEVAKKARGEARHVSLGR
jgi:2-dehydro-3-deoxyphosphogluconate aldolase/(4S)-4-hydroxy-2-oxoglutarate aldolase